MSGAKHLVGVVGPTGFAGGELVRLLAGHPQVELALLCGRTPGELGAARPGLAPLGLTVEAYSPERLAAACDTVFLALPHGESLAAAADLVGRGLTVIDLGDDHRLGAGGAFYSLPELTGPPPPDTKLVASPGCFATALALGLAPLAPRLAPGTRVVATGITGSSGGGAGLATTAHHPLRHGNVAAYSPLAHRHQAEVEHLLSSLGTSPPLDFVPHRGPFVRGIHMTIVVPAAALESNPRNLLTQAYAESALVGVREGPVDLGEVVGSARAVIGVAESGGGVAVFVVLDNLLKGAAGQAVQSLNLMRGWDEAAGLPLAALWP